MPSDRHYGKTKASVKKLADGGSTDDDAVQVADSSDVRRKILNALGVTKPRVMSDSDSSPAPSTRSTTPAPSLLDRARKGRDGSGGNSIEERLRKAGA